MTGPYGRRSWWVYRTRCSPGFLRLFGGHCAGKPSTAPPLCRISSGSKSMKFKLALVVALGTTTLWAQSQSAQDLAGGAKESPLQTARRFVRLQSGLLPDQWSELTNFFIETPKPQWNKVHVIDVVDIGIDTSGDFSDVSISTNFLGELDSSLRLSKYTSMRLPPESASACYGDDYFGFTCCSPTSTGKSQQTDPQSNLTARFHGELKTRLSSR